MPRQPLQQALVRGGGAAEPDQVAVTLQPVAGHTDVIPLLLLQRPPHLTAVTASVLVVASAWATCLPMRLTRTPPPRTS